ncbi:MAG: glycosyltransferase [Lachnospiraceae bacterium]|nr:glycosyltransferase [Lachnospiraceae bacterium]
MNILFLEWGCFGKVDAVFTLEQQGHKIFFFEHPDYVERISPNFEKAFDNFVEKNHIELCFSFNFYPVLSSSAKKNHLNYVSIVYDSPFVMLYSYTIIYDTNYVFLFDKHEYLKLRNMGIKTVYYMPLPVNGSIIDYLLTKEYDLQKLSADISFVGALYHEDHDFFSKLDGISNYTRGYLEGLMNAQLQVSGYNFIEETLPKDIVDDMQSIVKYNNSKYGIETPEYIFANYFINRKLTAIERRNLLTAAAKCANLRLYTLDNTVQIPNAQNMGAIDYYSEMPYVFHNSKINLNITLRSIQSGIPLRCMDIMGAGGFLLTNFQADFLDDFIPDVDFVYFEDERDLVFKIDYYLTHDQKRSEIARNGHEKVLKNHSFERCFEKIFNIVLK